MYSLVKLIILNIKIIPILIVYHFYKDNPERLIEITKKIIQYMITSHPINETLYNFRDL